MKTLNVALGERSYPIYIGEHLMNGGLLQQHIQGPQVVIISNDTIADLYAQNLKTALAGFEIFEVRIPDGEAHKDFATLKHIFDQLLLSKQQRSTTLLALGGGVIGDITGFAAACYMRGVAFVQLPTSLLAQVDSSVGGKTGINHPLAKNMIGAFYQPRCVIADTTALSSLADRQFYAGLAEVIKYGLIADVSFFSWLETRMEALLRRDAHTLAEVIARSCAIKATVVAADEKEQGRRAILNLGHTFGHAIEAITGYEGECLHGEAVAMGMVIAAELSLRLNLLTVEEVARVKQLIQKAHLPTFYPQSISPENMIGTMRLDKKVQAGRLHFVLLERLGSAIISADVPSQLLLSTLKACRQH